VSVATAGGKVAAFAAFASRVGVGLVVLPRKAGAAAETAARQRAAGLAVADALRVPADKVIPDQPAADGFITVALAPDVVAHYADIPGSVRAQTARHEDAVVATTVCEAARR
jgi:hypothetical protein